MDSGSAGKNMDVIMDHNYFLESNHALESTSLKNTEPSKSETLEPVSRNPSEREKQACIYCDSEFEKRPHGYKRCSVDTLIGKVTVAQLLQLKTEKKSFVCLKCYSLLHKRETYRRANDALEARKKKSFEELTSTEGPNAKKRLVVEETAESSVKKCTKKDLILKALHQSHYGTALNQILSTKSGRAAFQKLIRTIVKKELRIFSKMQSPHVFHETVSKETIRSFSWKKVMKDASKHLPVIYSFLTAMVGTADEQGEVDLESSTVQESFPALGIMLGIITHKKRPKKFKFLQTLNSLKLYNNGCSDKLLNHFYKMGITLGPNGTRANIKAMKKEYGTEMKEWKTDIERDLNHVSEEDEEDDATESDMESDGSGDNSSEPTINNNPTSTDNNNSRSIPNHRRCLFC